MVYDKYVTLALIIVVSGSLFFSATTATANADLSEIYLERARLYYQGGNTEEAMEECEKILSFQPDNEEAQSMIVEIQTNFKSTETAYLHFIREFGSQGFQEGELSTYITLTVDDEDNVYVADSYNHNIQKFDSQGNLLFTFSRHRSQRDNFYRPSAITCRGSTLYVADLYYHELRQFDLDGHPISWFLFKNEKIETPIDITVNEKQDIFLLDGTLVRKFTVKGELEKEFGEGRLSYPKAIILTQGGDIAIADKGKNPIKLFLNTGQFVSQFGGDIVQEPVGIAEDREGKILVIDRAKSNVIGFDKKGNFLTQYQICQTKLSDPIAIAISPHNVVYIAHKGKNRIVEFKHKYARSKEEHMALGQLYLQEKANLQAIDEFQKAIKLGLNTSGVHYLLGQAYHEEKRWNKAIPEYEKAIKIRPQAEKYFYCGNAYYATKMYEKAAQNFQKAILLDPKDTNSRNNLGYAYLQMGWLDSAFERFTEVLELDPNYVDALIGRGIVYYKNKEYNKAIVEYKKIFQLDPTNKAVYYYLGQSYYDNGEYNKAIKVLEKVSREGPYFVDSLYYLGLAYHETNKTKEAIEAFHAALKIAPHREDIKKALHKIQR